MTIREFARNETGGAGVWSIGFLISVIVLAGLSIDGTNSMRAKEHLQSTADIAAHSGVVALAKGGSESEIRTAVSNSVSRNMPADLYGDVVGNTAVNVEIGTFDSETFSPSSTGLEDAVRVTLEMSSARGNPVGTFLLNFIGRDSWNVVAGSTSVFLKTKQCNGNDGIYAHGPVKLTSSADFSANFCVFSKQAVEMSNHNVFNSGAHVAMPDLANCKACEDAHNPGVEEAKLETNMQLVDVGAHITSVMNSMLGLSSYAAPRTDFLSTVALDSDLTPLQDAGYNTASIKKGDIIQISKADFETMAFVPTGLIYAVYCGSPLAASGAITPSPGGGPGGGGGGGGGGGSTGSPNKIAFETPTGAAITDVAVMTDCQLSFGTTAYVQNSVISTSSTSVQSVAASANAVLGSTSAACSGEKVVVMTQGDMSIPAALQTNNVDFLIAGDFQLASGTVSATTKRGTSFYVGGEAQVSAQGNWTACGDDADSLNGDLKVIRHVVPNSSTATSAL